MKIKAYFKAGGSQTFIVPEDILAIDFQKMAEAVGGRISKVEFL